MASIVSLLLHPERRRAAPPQRVDLRRVVIGGIAAWASGLVVSAVLLATGVATALGVATCAVGIVLGGIGLLWERTHRDDYRAPVPGEVGEPGAPGPG